MDVISAPQGLSYRRFSYPLQDWQLVAVLYGQVRPPAFEARKAGADVLVCVFDDTGVWHALRRRRSQPAIARPQRHAPFTMTHTLWANFFAHVAAYFFGDWAIDNHTIRDAMVRTIRMFQMVRGEIESPGNGAGDG